MIDLKMFYEYAEIFGNFYGTSKQSVDEILGKKNDDKKFERIMKRNKIAVFNIGYTNNNKSIRLEYNGLNKIVKEKGYIHKF